MGHLLRNAWPSVQLATEVVRDLFADGVNSSSGEAEPPAILQWLSQTFAPSLERLSAEVLPQTPWHSMSLLRRGQ